MTPEQQLKNEQWELRRFLAKDLPFTLERRDKTHKLFVVYRRPDGVELEAREATEIEVMLYSIWLNQPEP